MPSDCRLTAADACLQLIAQLQRAAHSEVDAATGRPLRLRNCRQASTGSRSRAPLPSLAVTRSTRRFERRPAVQLPGCSRARPGRRVAGLAEAEKCSVKACDAREREAAALPGARVPRLLSDAALQLDRVDREVCRPAAHLGINWPRAGLAAAAAGGLKQPSVCDSHRVPALHAAKPSYFSELSCHVLPGSSAPSTPPFLHVLRA